MCWPWKVSGTWFLHSIFQTHSRLTTKLGLDQELGQDIHPHILTIGLHQDLLHTLAACALKTKLVWPHCQLQHPGSLLVGWCRMESVQYNLLRSTRQREALQKLHRPIAAGALSHFLYLKALLVYKEQKILKSGSLADGCTDVRHSSSPQNCS